MACNCISTRGHQTKRTKLSSRFRGLQDIVSVVLSWDAQYLALEGLLAAGYLAVLVFGCLLLLECRLMCTLFVIITRPKWNHVELGITSLAT